MCLALQNLVRLNMRNNKISTLTKLIFKLENLAHLRLDSNPITCLPHEVNYLKYLREVSLEDCPLLNDVIEPDLEKERKVPTLKELAARTVIKNRITLEEGSVPSSLITYTCSHSTCSFCSGPYYEHHVQRYRLLFKWGYLVPFVYDLCKGHWNSEKQRVFEMFQPKLSQQPTFILSQKTQMLRAKSSSRLESKSSKSIGMKKALSASFVPPSSSSASAAASTSTSN